jgi:uncharacterized protein YwgA
MDHVDREHLPLLVASRKAASDDEKQPLDRLRMQKAVFLLQEKGPESWRRFQFHPYDWGPYSRELAATVVGLAAEGLLDKDDVRFYSAYKTTDRGEEIAAEIFANLRPEERELVRRIRHFVTTRSFSQLLKEIYSAYPSYAAASRFRP